MNVMSLERFRTQAEAYGGELARWPQHEREAAQARLMRCADARQSLRQAGELDAWLAHEVTPAPHSDLRRAIVLAAEGRIGAGGLLRALWRELGGLRVAGPAFAGSLALGIAAAAMVEAPLEAEAQAPAYAELALLDPGYEDYSQ
ncbi:MAG TPA: hypothetical protein VFG21_00430 [Xanthomonadaceae bacterium]|nr:hypothetical protein [Xanthomonadaceae bacterium]